ncbi:MAG: hypothetical protein J0M24_06000 [Verrucomicrobia bacterium]|nr:hypothetical protein [Verrucomicrobiota bacterium]
MKHLLGLADLATKHGLKLATLDRHLSHPHAEVIAWNCTLLLGLVTFASRDLRVLRGRPLRWGDAPRSRSHVDSRRVLSKTRAEEPRITPKKHEWGGDQNDRSK